MTPPDRLVGALCLVVAAVAATWGRGPAEEAERRAAGRETLEVAPGGGTDAPVAAAQVTSTTASPSTTTSSGKGSASSTTATAPATSTTTAPPSKEADEALAKRALLTQADLPGGFVVVRQAPSGPGDGDGPFERCLGSDAATLTAAVRAKARSGEYGRSGAGTVSSSSAVLDTPASAEKVLATLATPAARACFEGLINARLARNPNLSEDVRGTMSPLDASGFGDQSTGFRFEVQLPAEDVENDPSQEKVPYIADFVFVRQGRALALVEFGNLHQPFPAPDLQAVVTNLARRAE
ncbi:MAG TPA: hypothetical protein VGL92_10900 [Acidimicrobiia bacterium]